MIYLDNAATSWPKPESVYTEMDNFLRQKGGNPGHGSHSLAEAARRVVEETRLLTARFIGAQQAERVIFTQNCTDSLNLALKGCLHAGDQVIVSSLEHNAVMRPLAALAKTGVDIIWIPISPETGVCEPADIAAAITPHTRMIVMVHVSNVNGVIQPVAEYAALARKHGLALLVDAAQSAGHIPLNVEEMGIDLLGFSAHKGPLGPPGLGVLYIGPRVNPATQRQGGTGSFSETEEQPEKLPDKYEAGTLNSPGIAGLGAGLAYIRSEGLEKIAAHELYLTRLLIEGLSAVEGLTLYRSPQAGRQGPLVAFNLAGHDPGEVGVILDQAFDIKVRTGLHCAPAAHRTLGTYPHGSVRLSPGYFNTCQQIEATVRAIAEIARQPSGLWSGAN